MNKIIDLQEKSDKLSSSICTLSKPFMLTKEHSQEIRQLLSSESDLRLGIEFITEGKTQKELQENIILVKQEADIILYSLMQLKKKQVKDISPIIAEIEEIISILNTL